MARYIIEGDGFVRINETYGTIENLSDFEAQVYTSPTADEGLFYIHGRGLVSDNLYMLHVQVVKLERLLLLRCRLLVAAVAVVLTTTTLSILRCLIAAVVVVQAILLWCLVVAIPRSRLHLLRLHLRVALVARLLKFLANIITATLVVILIVAAI